MYSAVQRALERQRRWALPVFGTVALGHLAAALLSSAWWLLGAAVFGVVPALSTWQHRRLHRCVADLAADARG